MLRDSDDDVMRAATDACARIGAFPVSPELPRALSDMSDGRTERDRAIAIARCKALASCPDALTSDALPAIVDALGTDQRSEVLRMLVAATGQGFDVAPLVPIAAGLFIDGDWRTRETDDAAFSLLASAAEQGADVDVALPALAWGMTSNAKLRFVRALIARGIDVRPVVPSLLRALARGPGLAPGAHPDTVSRMLHTSAGAAEALALAARDHAPSRALIEAEP
jgi:hypothetical protein